MIKRIIAFEKRGGRGCPLVWTALLQSFHQKTPDLDATSDDNDGRPAATLRPNSRCRSALAALLFGRQRPGDANREIVLVLALLADDSSCAPAKFQRIGAVYDLTTGRQQRSSVR